MMKIIYALILFIGLTLSFLLDSVAKDGFESKKNDSNAQQGELFLRNNLKRAEVKETKSGLQYEVLAMKDKNNTKPTPNDAVRIHYKGVLIDGTVFEETNLKGEPALIFIDKAFPGWAEGLQLMPIGSKFRFYIPPALAYGNQQLGPIIKPNSVLIFEIELLEIVDRRKLEDDKKSPIDPSDVDLINPNKCAQTFLTLYTNIIPTFTGKDIAYTCEAIATDGYRKQCESFLEKRLLNLQKLPISRALFDNKFVSGTDQKNNIIEISWREEFEFKDGKKNAETKKIILQLLNKSGQWRVESAIESIK